MDKNKSVKVFCTVLSDFFKDIYASYPEASLMMLMKIVDGMILTNPRGVVDNFMYCIGPYVDKIKNKDERFFLDGGLNSNVSDTYLLDEIKKIINIWKNPDTPEKTKSSIWKYFQILCNLGEKITNLKK